MFQKQEIYIWANNILSAEWNGFDEVQPVLKLLQSEDSAIVDFFKMYGE